MWADFDPVTGKVLAWKIGAAIDRAVLTSGWTAARTPPKTRRIPSTASPPANGTVDTLTTHTTHIKEGYLRRNGVPTSDQPRHRTLHGVTATYSPSALTSTIRSI